MSTHILRFTGGLPLLSVILSNEMANNDYLWVSNRFADVGVSRGICKVRTHIVEHGTKSAAGNTYDSYVSYTFLKELSELMPDLEPINPPIGASVQQSEGVRSEVVARDGACWVVIHAHENTTDLQLNSIITELQIISERISMDTSNTGSSSAMRPSYFWAAVIFILCTRHFTFGFL